MRKHLQALIAFTTMISVALTAQQRYLVSPNDEVIPLKKNEKAVVEILKRTHVHHRDDTQPVSADYCGIYDEFITGPEDPPNSNFGALHKQVLGQWYVARATGTIDTLFWYQYDQIGALDSTIIVRIHKSNIGPDFGPGSPSTPWWRPPCQNWGYWPNSQDLDQGIAPFPEEAYPETAAWRSTINNSPGHPSTPPFSIVKWGYSGVPVKVRRNSTNFIKLATVQPCSVTIGEKFFISMRVNSPNYHIVNDTRTEWFAWGARVTPTNVYYPSRNWKFYEHDSGASNCSGIPVSEVKRGWVARGGFGNDSLDVALYTWWFTMTVTSNTPPIIHDEQIVHTTLSTGPQRVRVEVIDCNLVHPESAGVASVVVGWSLNDVPQPDIAMSPLYGGIYEGYIPGCPAGSTINYSVRATDLNGAQTNGTPHSYQVLSLRNQYYLVDTSYACVHKSIAAIGLAIDTGAFFVPPYPGHGREPKDDGTAGPFELPGPMTFFGQESLRYVWIGVNGGIALSKHAIDTIDVNSNGGYRSFIFPGNVHHYRSDTWNIEGTPPNFIAPFWADWIYGDTSGTVQYGHIRHHSYSECEYVVEWDSLGDFDANGSQTDIDVFRVVLNHCDGTIEFQWDNVGTRGNESECTVGMQADSNALTAYAAGSIPGYLSICRNGYPSQLVPRNNWCIKFYPGAAYYANDGWNLISIPTIPYENDYRVSSLFPHAKSDAYVYQGKYQAITTVSNGTGFWMKFQDRPYASVGGYPVTHLTIPVTAGWNIIGSLIRPVPVSSIGQVPDGIIRSYVWAYSGDTDGYARADTIYPGRGYWVKVGTHGNLLLDTSWTSTTVGEKLSDWSLEDDLPPPPPELSRIRQMNLPYEYALEQNYPNPFNPSTEIRYQMPEARWVTLKMYDVLGRQVATLVNELRQPGEYSVRWDASNQPSGVYYYRLMVGTFSDTKKMLLIR